MREHTVRLLQTQAGETGRDTKTGWRETPIRSADGNRPYGTTGDGTGPATDI